MNAPNYHLIYRGTEENLQSLDKDPKAQINGWTGRGFGRNGNYFQLSTHSDSELLLTYIEDYVKKTYPNIQITKWMYDTQQEVK